MMSIRRVQAVETCSVGELRHIQPGSCDIIIGRVEMYSVGVRCIHLGS